ncbi:MAG: hypothetical protein KIT20_06700 [Alphaproteobacteria bacterium]|nr:hypothetical protein [Alphaproteobacteria bacterium]
MSLANYDELALALADWINRDDLAGRIGDFVTLCESRLNRLLRVGQMEREVEFAFDGGARDFELPPDFLEARLVAVAEGRGGTMRLLAPGSLAGAPAPGGYAIAGDRLRFAPEAARGGGARLVYYAALPPLVREGSNWLLARHPDIYLHGALAEAEAYVRNPEKLALWRGLQEQSLEQLRAADRLARWSGGTLATDPAVAGR